jgi:hypothetical protein
MPPSSPSRPAPSWLQPAVVALVALAALLAVVAG